MNQKSDLVSKINIPSNYKTLLVDNCVLRTQWFLSRLYNVCLARSEWEATEFLVDPRYDFRVVCLNDDLGSIVSSDTGEILEPNGNGLNVAKFMRNIGYAGQVLIHSTSDRAEEIAAVFPRGMVAPFGSFELEVGAPSQSSPNYDDSRFLAVCGICWNVPERSREDLKNFILSILPVKAAI